MVPNTTSKAGVPGQALAFTVIGNTAFRCWQLLRGYQGRFRALESVKTVIGRFYARDVKVV